MLVQTTELHHHLIPTVPLPALIQLDKLSEVFVFRKARDLDTLYKRKHEKRESILIECLLWFSPVLSILTLSHTAYPVMVSLCFR